ARAAAAAARQAGRTPPSSKAAAPNARAVASGAPAVTPVSSRGGSARPAPSARAVDVAALLRASPWTPVAVRGEPSAERVGLRFHADGVVDVLRVRTGSGARIAPMTGAAGAWRVEGGRLQVAVVADAFVAACSGAPRADGALVLACEERTAPDRLAAAARTDFARTLLEDVGANGGRPSLLAIASDRAGRASDAGDGMGVAARPRIEATLAGLGPAACRPGPGRPPVPSAGTRLGDWYAFDVRRFEAVSPLSGRMCPQTSARAAALSACSGDSCRSVGGCPAGQVSALAGLPGVDAGWVGCDANPVAARERALAACRADLGCDCQVVALSGRNLNTLGGGACPVPSQTRAPAEAG
ncbi:MAG TPA: hypothetical protein VEA81_11965, partial [Burkholderiaceae bacterium]|nr:hypothetical protein [Burkholderiaceae bacterium]